MTTDTTSAKTFDYPAPTMSADEIPLAYSLVALHQWERLIQQPSDALMSEARRDNPTLGAWWASTSSSADMLWLAEQGGDVLPPVWLVRTFVIPDLLKIAGALDAVNIQHNCWRLLFLCQKAETLDDIKEIQAIGVRVHAGGYGLDDLMEPYAALRVNSVNNTLFWITEGNTPAAIVTHLVPNRSGFFGPDPIGEAVANAVRALWPTPPNGIVALMRRVCSYQYVTGNGLPPAPSTTNDSEVK